MQRLAESVIGETVPDSWNFDRLIVDEGQDLDGEWLEILQLFLNPGHDLIWLEDPNQNLYGRTPVSLEGSVGFRAPWNYRSPESIAGWISEHLPFEFEPGNQLPGLGVGITPYDESDEQPLLVSKIVSRLLKQGFSYNDIALLTCRGYGSSVFGSIEKIGAHTLRRFTGDYDMFGNQLLTDGDLLFDSVYRFKGQQAAAIILVDVDPNDAQLETFQKVLYCGMSRATVRLEAVCNRRNPANRLFLTNGKI